MRTGAVARTARDDAQSELSTAEMTVADAATIHHEAEIPQQLEV
jgi:hypothetical protein